MNYIGDGGQETSGMAFTGSGIGSGYVSMYGTNFPNGQEGMAEIVSRTADGTPVHSYQARRNGCYIDNVPAVKTVNGVGADASGNVGISRVWQCDGSDICYGAIGWWHGGATLPNYGTWAYIMSTNYRGIGEGSSDGASWAGEAAGGTNIGGDSRGTGLLAVRKG